MSGDRSRTHGEVLGRKRKVWMNMVSVGDGNPSQEDRGGLLGGKGGNLVPLGSVQHGPARSGGGGASRKGCACRYSRD